jgi:hypothetical protein
MGFQNSLKRISAELQKFLNTPRRRAGIVHRVGKSDAVGLKIKSITRGGSSSQLRAHINPKFVDREHFEHTTMQKRTEITIETERFLVVNQRRERSILWCSVCEENVPMLAVYAAARTAGTTPVVISELAKAGQLHSALTLDGQRYLCPNSLASLRAQERS